MSFFIPLYKLNHWHKHPITYNSKKEFNIICFIYLVYSHVVTSFCLAGHIYAVVALKGNEWGTDYWLARCLEGKKTLNVSITDSEGIHIPIESMVIKGEYLTLDERT